MIVKNVNEKIGVIYENDNFLAVYKPAGLLVHGTINSKDEPTLVSWLLNNYPEVKNVGDEPETRPGIVHRLDRDTSGIVLIARNQEYFDKLKAFFQSHSIKKNYLALVWGEVKQKQGIIKKAIRLKRGTVKRTVWSGAMEKEAITEYKVLKYFVREENNKEQKFSLLEVSPKTGRTHQIRVHLNSIGHPVVGDKLYGSKKTSGFFNLNRLFLHAESLEFSLDGSRFKFESDPPEELKNILDKFSN